LIRLFEGPGVPSMSGAPCGSELCRRLVFQSAVSAALVVFHAPSTHALVAKLAVEALDVGILRGLAGLDEVQLNPVLISPGADRTGQSAKTPRPIEHSCHVATGDAVIDHDINRLFAKSSTIVKHFSRRPYSSASRTKSIDHTWFGRSGATKGRPLYCHAAPTAPLPHLQALLAIQSVHAFDVHPLTPRAATTREYVDIQSAAAPRPAL
jgi:hypothetical protein